ncbi:hypothetical protein V6N12_029342 [Hibiscus sabdariffa]|uniref:Uncharacterized protein n=1 Tax=Hibiscus sabdariffa TaxID=183260 RepID=A0ABR2CW79_9ROSI
MSAARTQPEVLLSKRGIPYVTRTQLSPSNIWYIIFVTICLHYVEERDLADPFAAATFFFLIHMHWCESKRLGEKSFRFRH